MKANIAFNKKSFVIELIPVLSIVFILTNGTGVVAPLLAPYSLTMGANGLWVGAIYSGFYIVRFIVGSPIGIIADRIGPKWILTISLGIYPFIALSYYFSNSLVTLFCARLLHGLASAMLLPMAMTYIGEVTPRGKEGSYMGLYNTVLFLANGIGPILGGWVTDRWNVKSAFLLLFVLSLGTLLLIFTTVSTTRKGMGLVQEKDTKKKLSTTIWKNGNILSLASTYFATAVLTMFIISFFPLFGIEKHFSTIQVGILIAVYNVTIGLFQLPLGKLADKYEKTRLLLGSCIGIAVLLFIIPKQETFTFICGTILIFSLLTALAIASSSALASESGKRYGMGKTMGLLSSATSLGMIIGPLLSGFIIQMYPISYIFYSVSGFWLISAVIIKYQNKKKKHKWSAVKDERIFSNDHT